MTQTKSGDQRIAELERENARLARLLARAGLDAHLAESGENAGFRALQPSEHPIDGTGFEAAERRARDRLILESAVDFAILATDPDGRITTWNEGAYRILGWSADEMRGAPAATIFTPEDREAGVPGEEMRTALAQGRAADERWHLKKDGSRFWALGKMMPIIGRDGAHQGYLKILQDRTQQRLNEEKLRASEERLRLTFGAAGFVGIWDMDVSLGIIRTNARFAELFSLSPELGEQGTPMTEYLPSIHHDDRPAVEAALTATLERGEPYNIEYRVLQPNGDARWVLAHGSRTETGPDGKALRFTGVVVEITDRKKVEARQAALIELGDRLRESTDTAEMAFAAAEIMGRTLGLTRAGYGTVDPERGTIGIERDWTAPGIASIAGIHRYEEYGALLDDLRKGETVSIDDVACDPRTASDTASFDKLGIRALLNAPLLEHGHLVAVFFLNDSKARHWSPEKLAFIHDIADRTRASIERRRAEDHQALLLNELQHRVKNTLSMVQAIASQTFRETATPAAREAFTARLVALSQANDILTKAGWSAAPVHDVVTGATIPHCAGPERFTIKGPAIEIAAKAALSLTLALHELCTNAAKYGALSNEDGHVLIDWDVLDDATFRLRWAERGGPLVHKPTRTGFGTRLIERSLGPQLRGEVKTDFDPGGITCTVEVPLTSVQVAGTA